MTHHVHTLNTSAAKQKYSFSKASRFDLYLPKYPTSNQEPTSLTCPQSQATGDPPLWGTASDLSSLISFTTPTLTPTNCHLPSITNTETPSKPAGMYNPHHLGFGRTYGNPQVQPQHPWP